MKYSVLLFLILASCTLQRTTTESLVTEAKYNCRNTPELDMQQLLCVYSYIKLTCSLKNLDIKICGEVAKE